MLKQHFSAKLCQELGKQTRAALQPGLGTAEMSTTLKANPSSSRIWRVWYPWDPCNKLNLEVLHWPHGTQRIPIPVLGIPGMPTWFARLLHCWDLAAWALRDDLHGVIRLLARPTRRQLLWDHRVGIWERGEEGCMRSPGPTWKAAAFSPLKKCPQLSATPMGHRSTGRCRE